MLSRFQINKRVFSHLFFSEPDGRRNQGNEYKNLVYISPQRTDRGKNRSFRSLVSRTLHCSKVARTNGAALPPWAQDNLIQTTFPTTEVRVVTQHTRQQHTKKRLCVPFWTWTENRLLSLVLSSYYSIIAVGVLLRPWLPLHQSSNHICHVCVSISMSGLCCVRALFSCD